MAKAVKKQEAAVKKGSKSSVKVRSMRDITIFSSKSDVGPLNDVIIGDVLVKGLTTEEKIAQGEQPPYRQVISFKKTDEERARVKELKIRTRLTGWAPPLNRPAPTNTLTVYLHNREKENRNKFKNVHTFRDVKESEIAGILYDFFIKKREDADARGTDIINFYLYGGKLVPGKWQGRRY